MNIYEIDSYHPFTIHVLGGKAIPTLWKFLNRWPQPECVCQEDEEEMAQLLFPIGLNYVRAQTIIRFSGK